MDQSRSGTFRRARVAGLLAAVACIVAFEVARAEPSSGATPRTKIALAVTWTERSYATGTNPSKYPGLLYGKIAGILAPNDSPSPLP